MKPYANLKRMQSVSQIVDAEHRIIFSLIVFIKEWKARAHFVFFRNCCFQQQTKILPLLGQLLSVRGIINVSSFIHYRAVIRLLWNQ